MLIAYNITCPMDNCTINSIMILISTMDNISVRKLLAQNMKRGRKILNINQFELAARSNISPGFVAEIETCRKFPSPEVLERIANSLKLLPYQLFLTQEQWGALEQEYTMKNLHSGIRERLHSEIDNIFDPYLSK